MASSFMDDPTLRAWATFMGLPIPPEAEAGVVANLDRLQALAMSLLEFPLSDHDEPLPIVLYDGLADVRLVPPLELGGTSDDLQSDASH